MAERSQTYWTCKVCGDEKQRPPETEYEELRVCGPCVVDLANMYAVKHGGRKVF